MMLRMLWLVPCLACAHAPEKSSTVPDDMPDDLRPKRRAAAEARAEADAVAAAPDAERWRGRIIVAGHAEARFAFAVPAGLAPLRGVTLPADVNARIELGSAGPDGVGLADGARVAVNSVVVFSDPEGLGVEFAGLNQSGRRTLAVQYGDGVRERFPDARPPQILEVGTHLALRIDLPRVVMAGRPERRGRHYLVFDRAATASIDCVWTDAEAARMSRACDAVAAELRRVP